MKRRMSDEATPLTRFSLPALVGVVVALSMTVQASADASPPLYPPGSAVLPPGQTMVQMVSEVVDITVPADIARAQFEASFAMRNQGAAAEQMDVRFPLTDADSWETIWDFAAYVDGQRVRVSKSVEPFSLGNPSIARWAVFPVTFEPGVDVEIRVTYSTAISGWGWGGAYDVGEDIEDAFFGPMTPDTATVYYTLETGAGWYGSIGRGTVVLRLPYEAGPANVFDLDAGLAEGRYGGFGSGTGEGLSGPSFAGNEARWEFANLEPTTEDNLSLQFLWPKEWQRILTLRAAAERNPHDPAAAIRLAGAYLAAGADVQSSYANEYHCALSRQALDPGLKYDPSSELLLEAQDIIAYYCPEPSSLEEGQAATQTPAATTASEEPAPSPPAVATIAPTADRSPTADARESPTAAPTAKEIATAEVQKSTATPTPTNSAASSSAGVRAVVAIGLVVVIALALIVVRRRRTPR